MSDMVWKPRASKWNWRQYLTPEEKQFISKIDKLDKELRSLRGEKNMIMNRAIQRAKFEARQQ